MALPTLLARTPTLRGWGAPGAVDGIPEPLRLVAESQPQSLLRVGLIGFGRTGREVAKLLLTDTSMSLKWVLRRSESQEHRSVAETLGVQSDESGIIHSASHVSPGELLDRFPVDVIIDFSSESGIDYYGDQAAHRRIAIVSAISRYSEARQRQLSRLAGPTRVVWSPNITIGINFLLLASQSLQRIAPSADVQIIEEHFRDKAEVSGTALRLAQALEAPDDSVHSVRAGGIVGVHEVIFGFPAQTVRLRHEAISREAFGHGALFAARQVHPREPGLYRMEDLLLPFFARGEHAAAPRPAPMGGLRGRLASQLRAAARLLE